VVVRGRRARRAEIPSEDTRGDDKHDGAEVEQHGFGGGLRGLGLRGGGLALQRGHGREMRTIDREIAFAEGARGVGRVATVDVGDARRCDFVAVAVAESVGEGWVSLGGEKRGLLGWGGSFTVCFVLTSRFGVGIGESEAFVPETLEK
jgi:hypothetical protein